MGVLPAATAVLGACVAGFIAEWGAIAAASSHTCTEAYRELTARHAIPSDAHSRRATRVLGLGYPLVIGATLCIPLIVPALVLPGPAWEWLAAGFGVAVAASGLRAWAVVTLGRLFDREGLLRESHRLIRTGPYRIVRHPAYSANVAFAIGAGMMLANWASTVAATVLVILVHEPRIRNEEALLARRFPDDYPRYTRDTGRLTPRARS